MDGHTPTPLEMNMANFRAVKLLGKGATGTVFLVHHHHDNRHFALKVVDKSSAVHHHHADRRARHEISVLRRLGRSHPFLPHLIGSAEDDEFIWWAIPYCPGGDLNVLRYHQNDHVFSPAVIRFYLAEIICALHHLHRQGIVYRDLKPENILVQLSGHVTLTDFDLSRDLAPVAKDHEIHTTPVVKKRGKSARVSPVSRRTTPIDYISANQRSNSFVGTEEYVAPEVIRGDGHEFAVDWWALGVLAYEMLYGYTPFKGKNRKETFQKLLWEQPQFIGKPNALTDLIGKLLVKDPTRRLGYRRGAAEIKEHDFFRGLRWEMLTEVMRPPFLPLREETSVAECGFDIREYLRQLKRPPSPLRSPSFDERRNRSSLTEF